MSNFVRFLLFAALLTSLAAAQKRTSSNKLSTTNAGKLISVKAVGSTTYTEFRNIFEKDHALARRDQVIGSLTGLTETEHARPAQPPGGRHRRKVGCAIRIHRADERYRRSEIENRGINGFVFVHGRFVHTPG